MNGVHHAIAQGKGGAHAINESSPDQGGATGSSFPRWNTGEVSHGTCGGDQEKERQLQVMIFGWGRWYAVESVSIDRMLVCQHQLMSNAPTLPRRLHTDGPGKTTWGVGET